MRKYLVPAMRYASRALPQQSQLRTFMIKRRMVSLSMAMSFLVVTAMGMMAVNATANGDTPSATKYEDHADGKSLSTSITTTMPETINEGGSLSSSDVKTDVIVNGNQVPVAGSGNYSKTVTTDNGATHINVSSNSDSKGNGFTGSTSTTHTNVSTNSFTSDVHMYTSP